MRTGFWLIPANGIYETISRNTLGKKANGNKAPDKKEIIVVFNELSPHAAEV